MILMVKFYENYLSNFIVNCSDFRLFAFNFQTNPIWETVLFLLSWIYMALAIIEPSCANDAVYINSWKYDLRPAYIAIEAIVLVFYLVDITLAVFHRSHESYKHSMMHVYSNKKLIVKIIVNCLFVSDFIRTLAVFPTIPLRYSRFFRAGMKS